MLILSFLYIGKKHRPLYGIDHLNGYGIKDSRVLQGDPEVRRQAGVNKAKLGLCTPLALETNGTVFTANRLEQAKLSPVKRFASVFGKRVALTAVPGTCQTCECTSHDDGTSYVECFPCQYPGASMIEDVSTPCLSTLGRAVAIGR